MLCFYSELDIVEDFEMDKPIILVDLDDLTWDFNGAFIPYINQACGLELVVDDIVHFEFHDIIGVSREVMASYYEDFTHHHHGTIELMPGAAAGLEALAEIVTLEYCTSRCESAAPFTDGHLETLGLRHLFANGVHTNGVSKRYPGFPKSHHCNSVEAVALLDDAPGNMIDVAENTRATGIMLHRPWNRGFRTQTPLPDRILDAANWTEIVDKARQVIAARL